VEIRAAQSADPVCEGLFRPLPPCLAYCCGARPAVSTAPYRRQFSLYFIPAHILRFACVCVYMCVCVCVCVCVLAFIKTSVMAHDWG
jgi:hypothetical protein